MDSKAPSFDGETTSSDILWSEILCRIPFIKNASMGTGEKFQIDSKNEVEEVDAMQLEQFIQNQEVILSHSWTMRPQQHCRGIVEDFEYQDKNVKVTVSSNTGFPIWEDTDIWMYSLATPPGSSHNTEPNTSANSDSIQEELKTKPADMTQTELFQTINGWKLIEQKRQRIRKKFGDKWKNVYKTELEMTVVDPEKEELLKYVTEGTSLRFSDDIEETGDVLVDVISKTIKEGVTYTITLGVTGFTRTDVDISLTKDSTFYLSMYDGENDDLASLASEDNVLPGYPLEQNVDELCEKIGQLTITDVCVKTWRDKNRNVPYVRFIVTSERKMLHFKPLNGHHVVIQSATCIRESVLAVVSKVMRDEMVLTLKGVPRPTHQFFFSKTELITIQIDHQYEEYLRQQQGDLGVIESLRQQIINSDVDIRLHRKWRDISGPVAKSYASFTSKNQAFTNIPLNTKVLLGKCWEIEGPLDKKADFVFGIRADNSLCKYGSSSNKVVFEIKFYRNMVEDSEQHYNLSEAFYYVDFEFYQEVQNNRHFYPINARSWELKKGDTVSKMFQISKNLKFVVFPYLELFSRPLPSQPSTEEKKYSRKERRQHFAASTFNKKFSGGENQSSVKKQDVPNTEEKEKKDEVNISGLPKSVSAGSNKQSYFEPWFSRSYEQDWDAPIHQIGNASPPSLESLSTESVLSNPRDLTMEKLALDTMLTSMDPEKTLQQIDEKYRRLCYVYLTRFKNEGDVTSLQLETGFDEQGNIIQNVTQFKLGQLLALTAGTKEKGTQINVIVGDTNKISESHFRYGRQQVIEHGFHQNCMRGETASSVLPKTLNV